MLLVVLVALSVGALAYSSRYFTQKGSLIALSFGYLTPLVWFMIQLGYLQSLPQWWYAVGYAVIAGVYFSAWHMLRSLEYHRYQHISVYGGGIIAVIMAIMQWFPDKNLYTGLLIAYGGLIFA